LNPKNLRVNRGVGHQHGAIRRDRRDKQSRPARAVDGAREARLGEADRPCHSLVIASMVRLESPCSLSDLDNFDGFPSQDERK
jgi:hypothetical protein